MVATFKYYMFFNFCAIFFYQFVLECCQKMSYFGSRIIFAQWFDDLFKKEQFISYLYQRRILGRLKDLKYKPEYAPKYDYNRYGPGVDNSTLVDKIYGLDTYVTTNRRIKRFRADEFIGIDNFSDTVCTVGTDIDFMAFTVIGSISLLLLINCFIVGYIREQEMDPQMVVPLS